MEHILIILSDVTGNLNWYISGLCRIVIKKMFYVFHDGEKHEYFRKTCISQLLKSKERRELHKEIHVSRRSRKAPIICRTGPCSTVWWNLAIRHEDICPARIYLPSP